MLKYPVIVSFFGNVVFVAIYILTILKNPMGHVLDAVVIKVEFG